MTKDEALKLALEALEGADMIDCDMREAITALREALAEQPAQQDSTCNNTLRAQGKAYPRTCKKCGLGPCVGLAQQALDKKAENARELGLDYEPAQQAPVAWGVFEVNLHDMFFTEAEAVEMAQLKGNHAEVKPLYTAPQRKPQYDKTKMNCFVQDLYDKKMQEGKHGQYEAMFHVVHRAIEAAHGIKE